MTLIKGVKVHLVIYSIITIINSVQHDLAEKQIDIQPLKEFLALYGTCSHDHKTPPEAVRIVS
jgi:hypothetical protein